MLGVSQMMPTPSLSPSSSSSHTSFQSSITVVVTGSDEGARNAGSRRSDNTVVGGDGCPPVLPVCHRNGVHRDGRRRRKLPRWPNEGTGCAAIHGRVILVVDAWTDVDGARPVVTLAGLVTFIVVLVQVDGPLHGAEEIETLDPIDSLVVDSRGQGYRRRPGCRRTRPGRSGVVVRRHDLADLKIGHVAARLSALTRGGS